jgi:[glutamine synthetase] adenylyltransferase / [glutamine synthetase]-adenylyl-L-tyrosine phosphorylase
VANETFYARLGQRMIHMLTTRDAVGLLYEADMRLRPNGNAGQLVASLDAFENYQLQRRPGPGNTRPWYARGRWPVMPP